MPGPSPKPPHLRQRRNKVLSRAQLVADRGGLAPEDTRLRAPKLPPDVEWHPLTLSYWRAVWRSPMASQFLEADRQVLFRLAHLVNHYWTTTKPSTLTALEAQIRQEEARFGLSPLDRTRLQWEIERAEAEQRKKTKQPREDDGIDPRLALVQ